jgi:penicillin-binding protein 1C
MLFARYKHLHQTLKKIVFTTALISIFIGCILFTISLFHAQIIPYSPTLLLEDRYQNFIASFENEESQFGFWPLPQTLPQKVVATTIAAEDWRFKSHSGVDLRSVFRAFFSNYITKESYSGASTIAMQVVRMQSKKRNRSLFRKSHEALSAVWMTALHGRDEVMRHYLTIAPYGNRIAGINYASRRYYQKPLVDLSWAEAALLSALPNAPGRMNLYSESGRYRARKRAKSILKKAHHLGYITTKDLKDAINELYYLEIPKREKRPLNMIHAMHRARDYIKANPDKVQFDPLNPTIRLTLDSDLHDTVHTVLKKHFRRNIKFDADNISTIVLDRASGDILSYHGSESYFNNQFFGQINFAEIKRSTGSLLKPFIYGAGMEFNGYTPTTLLTDIGLYFGGGTTAFTPHNYDKKYLGPVLYKTALANSRNVPAVQVLKDVGAELFYQRLTQLGIAPDDGNHDYYGLGIAVGNFYASLYSMAQGYLTLANEGVKSEINWLYGFKHHKGKQLIDRDISLQVQRMLSDPLARLPSFPRGGFLEYPFPVALKTGTSRGYRDAWCIGWSDTYLVATWIGKANNRPMKGISGYGGAAPVVQDIFKKLHRDRFGGLDNISFPPPKGYKPYNINTLTGELATQSSAWSTMEYFLPGTEPTKKSNPFRWIQIDKRTGLLATPYCNSDYIISKKFLHLPSIFKDWADAQGLPVPPTRYCALCGATQAVEKYALNITAPIPNSIIYIDPEMPEEYSTITLNCAVKPQSKSVLWEVDGKEYKVVEYPYKVQWNLKSGKHVFRVKIPGTPFVSRGVSIEVY